MCGVWLSVPKTRLSLCPRLGKASGKPRVLPLSPYSGLKRSLPIRHHEDMNAYCEGHRAVGSDRPLGSVLLTVTHCVACNRCFLSNNLGRLSLQPRVPEHYSRYARDSREVIGKKVIVGDLDIELLLQEPE
jgi:hypothetical protein